MLLSLFCFSNVFFTHKITVKKDVFFPLKPYTIEWKMDFLKIQKNRNKLELPQCYNFWQPCNNISDVIPQVGSEEGTEYTNPTPTS